MSANVYATSARHTVFVYGSLLSGLGNHPVIDRDGTRLVGAGETVEGGWRMLDLGSFPGLVRCPSGAMAVTGEVYEVTGPTLRDLDRLEGFPRFYDRTQVEVRTRDGRTHTAWVYFLRDAGRDCPAVPYCDWRTHLDGRRERAARE